MVNYDIVCIAPHSWFRGIGGKIWRRRHHLMENLAKRHRVLFIEPAFYSPIRSSTAILRFSKNSRQLQRISENLWTLTLYNLLPLQETLLRKRIRTVKWFNDRTCLYQIKGALKHLNFNGKVLLWAYYTPRTVDILKRLRSDFVVYDVYDKYTEYATVDRWRSDYIEKQEQKIFDMSDVVFAVSKPLLCYCKKYNDNCYLIPNAAADVFFATDKKTEKLPHNLSSIPYPRIGYIGSIYDKLDLDILIYLAESRPNFSYIFIGPVRITDQKKKEQLRRLKELKNTYFWESLKVNELPQYYHGLDVCLAPYDMSLSQMAWSDMPLKFWECLGAGKALVTTIDSFINPTIREVILVACSKYEFVKAIDFALNNNLSRQIDKGIEVARKNTWTLRVKEMEKIIEKCCIRKTQVDV